MRYKLEAEISKNHPKRYESSIVQDFLQRANTEAFQNQLDEIASIIASKNSWGKVDITSQIPAMYIIESLAKLTILKKQSIKTTSEC